MYAGRNPGLAGKTTWKDNLSMKDHSPILKRNLTGCVAAVLLILFDQFTKMLAVAHLMNQPSNVLIDGVFELRYLENRGSAFGMMQNKLIILIPVTVVVTLLILYLFFKKLPATRHFFWLNAVAVLFFAGAIGNFIDRVRQGYVVDFFYFSLINFPIFNVADIYVTAAAFLLIFLCLFYYKEEDFEQIFPSGSSRQHSSEKKDND